MIELDEATLKSIEDNLKRYYKILRYYDKDQVVANEIRIQSFDNIAEYETNRIARMVQNIVSSYCKDWEEELKKKNEQLEENITSLFKQQED